MMVGPSLYEVAALVGEPVRLRVLVSLMGGEARPASELARIANVSPPAASAHLAKLVNGHGTAPLSVAYPTYFDATASSQQIQIKTYYCPSRMSPRLSVDAPGLTGGSSNGDRRRR